MLDRWGVTDPHIAHIKLDNFGPVVSKNTSIAASGSQKKTELFLQSSPEAAMKRLLADDARAMYQICPAFRGGESGRLHRSEFTMLEWYQPGFELDQLMREVSDLLVELATNFGQEFERPITITYADLFKQRFGINPHQASFGQLLTLINKEYPGFSSHLPDRETDEGVIDDALDLLFSIGIQPQLQQPHLVLGFPQGQAALARLALIDGDQVANRFELYWQGIELANGYDELTDTDILHSRGARDNRIRNLRGLPEMAVNEHLLQAMQIMPDCAGVAIGLDRLLMLLGNKSSLGEVLSF